MTSLQRRLRARARTMEQSIFYEQSEAGSLALENLPVAVSACQLPSLASVVLDGASPQAKCPACKVEPTGSSREEEATRTRVNPFFSSAFVDERVATETNGLTSDQARVPHEPACPKVPVSVLSSMSSVLQCEDMLGQTAGEHSEASVPTSDASGQDTSDHMGTVRLDTLELACLQQSGLSGPLKSGEDKFPDLSDGIISLSCCKSDLQVLAPSGLRGVCAAAAADPVQNGLGTGLGIGNSMHCATLGKEINVGSECIAMETQPSSQRRRKRRVKAMEQDGLAVEEDELLPCLKPVGITKYSPASYVARQLAQGLHEV